MNAVGIDVSKGTSTVTIMRQFGEVVASPFDVAHTVSEPGKPADLLKSLSGETKVVMECTGAAGRLLGASADAGRELVRRADSRLFDTHCAVRHIAQKSSSPRRSVSKSAPAHRAGGRNPASPQVVQSSIQQVQQSENYAHE